MPGLLLSLLPSGARDPVSTGSGNADNDNDNDDDDNDFNCQVIGSLEQQWSFCQPRFLVKDERGEAILSIEGPGIVCDCCSDIDFNIMSLVNESEVRAEYRHFIVMTYLNFSSLDWKNYKTMVRNRTGNVHRRTKLRSDFPNRS